MFIDGEERRVKEGFLSESGERWKKGKELEGSGFIGGVKCWDEVSFLEDLGLFVGFEMRL